MALNLKSVSGTRALMAAVLLLLPLIYFSTAIFGPVSLMPGDGWSQIMGIRILIGRMIAQGMLPLWNPYIFGGMPLLASIQPGALYPPSWLFAILTPRAAMNAMVITTYHLALIGAYLFARRIELDRASALVTGLIFTFGGYLLAHLGHTNRIAAAAWLPWILLAIEHLYRRAAWRWVTFGALFIMLQNLAGEFQMTFYSLLVCGPYALFSLALRPERERRWRVFVYLAAMALSGALLSAIQVIPARELLQLGERAGINYDYFSLYSFPPYHLFALIFPYFFGGAGTTPYYVTFWGNWNPPETTCYVGLAGLLLAFVAISGKWEKQERRMVWFWTVVTLAAMTLAFGSYLPFGLNRLLHRVPVFNLFRAAGRHYFEFSLAIAVLAGMGLNHLTHATEAAQRKRFKWAVAALTILVAATAVAYRFFLDRFPVFHPRYTTAHLLTNPEALIPLLIFALCVAAFLVHIRWRTRATSALMAAVVLIDLASWGWFFEWQVYRFDVAAALSDPPAVTFIKSREADLNSFRIVSQAADPYDKHYRELDYPNVSIARGLQSVNGYDPVRLGRFAAIAGEMSLAGTIPDPGAFGPSAQGFNLLNVRYLLRERSAPAATWSTAVAPELRFSENSISPQLEPGSHVELQADGTVATELALVSAMGNSTDIPDNAPVVRIRLHTRGGRVIER
ncbi:MAG TPA: YfhO family protein, partial [Blastocatellia bacterium]|nr:YfhO family protein [Blastocatellia bacterium]